MRKSPLGQIPNAWSQLSRPKRLPSSSALVNAPACPSHLNASQSDGRARSAVPTANAIAVRIAAPVPCARHASTSNTAIGGTSQAAPPMLSTASSAAEPTANGTIVRGLRPAPTESGTSAATRTTSTAVASSLTPPHSA